MRAVGHSTCWSHGRGALATAGCSKIGPRLAPEEEEEVARRTVATARAEKKVMRGIAFSPPRRFGKTDTKTAERTPVRFLFGS